MSTPFKGVFVFFVLLAVALPAAATWKASHLIYIPAVAQVEGAGASQWLTDLYITNVDDVNIDVAMTYLPSGLVDNGWRFSDRSTWLGPREDQGFGWVNEELADIPPNGSVTLRDVVGQYWLETPGLNGFGAMVVFAYESGTLEDDGSRVDALAVADARIFTETELWTPDPNGHGFLLEDSSYGQIMPGIPWYNMADAAAVSEEYDFSFQVLNGAEESSDYRYNVGVVNASDPQTSITVTLQPFQSNGEPYLDENENEIFTLQLVPPAAHLQFFRVFSSLWGITDAPPSMIKVAIVAWASTNPDPVVLMTSYGSLVDSRSNDPSTVIGSFASPFDVECMFPPPSDGEGLTTARSRPAGRLVQIPPRSAVDSRTN